MTIELYLLAITWLAAGYISFGYEYAFWDKLYPGEPRYGKWRMFACLLEFVWGPMGLVSGLTDRRGLMPVYPWNDTRLHTTIPRRRRSVQPAF